MARAAHSGPVTCPFIPTPSRNRGFHAFELSAVCLCQVEEELIPPHLEIAHIPYARGGPFPGIFMFTSPARMVRPVTQLATATRELIGSLEQSVLDIR